MINLKQLSHIDLNLLVTLQVLLEHRSVSVAASKLHLTQPAVSKALSRLREQFGEALFMRVSKGLVPTPFALGLQEPLQQWLESASILFDHEPFDPASWKGEFTLMVNEYLHMIVLPHLMQWLSKNAPFVVLKIRSQYRHQLEGLEDGELDFVLNLEFSDLSDAFHSEVLYTDTPAIFARANHPLRKKQSTREDLLRYPRVALRMPDMEKFTLFHPRPGQPALNMHWPVAYETDNLTAALATISGTDCLLPGAGVLAGLATRELNFKALPTATPPPVRIAYCLVSHKRVQHSPAHLWLRELIKTLVQELV